MYPNISQNSLYVVIFISYVIISCKTVIVSAYFNDVFFCFIILICQIGILIQNYERNNNEYIVALIFIIFTCVCFVFSLLFTKESNDDTSDNMVIDNYNNDKKSSN